MPYISDEKKERIQLPYITDVGELTYAVDKMAEELLWKMTGYDWTQLRYEYLAAVRGALQCAGEEFYRRVVAPYEDAKIVQNGDVFVVPHPELWDVGKAPDPVEPVPDHAAEAESHLRVIRGEKGVTTAALMTSLAAAGALVVNLLGLVA